LENAALIAGADFMDEQNGQVLLMTMHNSKGLEFDTVFIPGMEEGIFPLNRSISNPSELEEERRLCYVALTRARKHLYLSHSEYRKITGQASIDALRFLAEIGKNDGCEHIQ
jgi:DNA helicase-2/ATP-dependent DNA helicase PcrA